MPWTWPLPTVFGSPLAVPRGLVLQSDNGSIFLGRSFMEERRRLGIAHEFRPNKTQREME